LRTKVHPSLNLEPIQSRGGDIRCCFECIGKAVDSQTSFLEFWVEKEKAPGFVTPECPKRSSDHSSFWVFSQVSVLQSATGWALPLPLMAARAALFSHQQGKPASTCDQSIPIDKLTVGSALIASNMMNWQWNNLDLIVSAGCKFWAVFQEHLESAKCFELLLVSFVVHWTK
jgi:hypothetical protein